MKNIVLTIEEHTTITGEDIYCKTIEKSDPMSTIEYLSKAPVAVAAFKEENTTRFNGMLEYQLFFNKIDRFGRIVKKSRLA